MFKMDEKPGRLLTKAGFNKQVSSSLAAINGISEIPLFIPFSSAD
jgi:hypothetical protein